jgi:hypothetical protein
MDSLKFILRLNAASCMSFGLLFAIFPQMIAVFLGAVPKAVILLLGIGLLANGAHLIFAARRPNVREIEVIWFSLGDFCWWLATLALIAANIWVTAAPGIAAAVIVATFVAGLGVAQLWTFGRLTQGHTGQQHLKAIMTSWLALPLWVKLWLALLNGVFIAAFALLPARIGEVTLIAYVASAPLLAGQVGYDGGLRRRPRCNNVSKYSWDCDLHRRFIGRQSRSCTCQQIRPGQFQKGFKYLLLALEVGVKSGIAHANFCSNLAHRRAIETTCGKNLQRCV